ncbi:hypothetical protein PO909_005854 [Leuciscus waleckii]
MNSTTISRVYKEWCEKVKTSSLRQSCGRKCLVDARGQMRMGRLIQADRRATLTEITTRYHRGMQQSICEATTRTTLRRMGYNSRKAHRVPLISTTNRKKRLQFARAHQNWTVEDWKNVAWSDESRFLLRHSDGRVRIWRKQNENMDPSCLVTTVQAGGDGVMVWGMFSWHTLGNLHFCDGTINADKYIEILEHNMLPSRRHLFQGRPCIFQQDNAKPHSAHITKSWLRRKRIRVLDWPAYSPDLSPIENVWLILKRKMRQRRPRTVAHLKNCLQQEWDKITPETLHHLVSSVPKRLLSVVKRNGNITKW